MPATKRKKTVNLKEKTIATAQEAFLGKLSPATQKHVQHVREWFASDDRHTLKSRHDLGRQIEAIYKDRAENATGHYGLRFVASLCEMFGWDKGVVYNALAFVRAYTKEEIAALAIQPMANGRLITYAHLRAMAKVKLKADRAKLLKKAIAACWTRAELQDAIYESETGKNKEKADGRGRPLKPPKDLRGLLQQQERSAQDFVRRASEVWESGQGSLLRQAKRLPDNEVTPEKLSKIKSHAALLRQLIEKAEEQEQEAERAAAYLEKKLEKSEEQQKETTLRADTAGTSNGEQTQAG